MKKIITFYEARRALEILEGFLKQRGKNSDSIRVEFEKHGMGIDYPLRPTELEDFNLSTRAYGALKAYFCERHKKGETDLDILKDLTYDKLIKVRGIGKRTALEIIETKEYLVDND